MDVDDKNDFFKFIDKYNFTFTHELSGLSNESDLSVTQNARIFRDATTTAYVKNILGNEMIRFLFLDYTFHAINSNIKSEINRNLIRADQIPLMGNEDIYFIFKGGNVMNYFMELHLISIEKIFNEVPLQEVIRTHAGTDISPHILPYVDANNKEQTSMFNSFFAKLKENFKISDVDYSIIISASNYARYILIHGCIIKLLAQALSEISDNFDDIYASPNIANTDFEQTTDTTDAINDIDPYIVQYTQLKHIITHDKFSSYRDLIVREVTTGGSIEQVSITIKAKDNSIDIEYFDRIIRSITDAVTFINIIDPIPRINFTKIFGLITIIQYVQTIMYFNFTSTILNKEKLTRLDNTLRNHLQTLINRKFYNIARSDFYNVDKLNQLRTDLALSLNQLRGQIKYETFNSGLSHETNTYEIADPVDPDKIAFIERNNSIITSANNYINQQSIVSSKDESLHYISFNSVIKLIKSANTINFNLMRIKFNADIRGNIVKKNNIASPLHVPSEFIDVSIPFYDDTYNKSHVQHLLHTKTTKISLRNNQINRDIIIDSYSMDELNDDLQYVLYWQNYFAPWLDQKYDKRIIRMLFLSIVDAYNTDCINGNIQNKMITYRKFLGLSLILLNYALAVTANPSTPYPYDAIGSFLNLQNNSVEFIKAEIDSIMIRYKKSLFTQLLFINDEFKDIETVITFVIIYSKLLTLNPADGLKFFNKYREDYLYVPLTQSGFNNFMPASIQKYINMLQIIVDYGYKIFFVYDTLLRSRANIVVNPNPVKVGGDVDNFYTKYIKYKCKYLDLRSTLK